MDGEMDREDEAEGETVELDIADPDVRDTDDGGAMVALDDEDAPPEETEFYSNLAETMSESELNKIATHFLDFVVRDKEARKKRDEQYEEGIRRTGLGDDAPGGAQFQGASKVVHPMITEVCVDFSARAIKELFPPQGPVRDFIPGDPTPEKVAKAKRKTALMNWQLTVQCPSFRAELEQLLTQVPLGGAQYLKITWDSVRNRIAPTFVAIDDMLLPFAATNFYSAQRRTHVQYLTQMDYEARVKAGEYRDIDLTPPGMEPERSIVDIANDKIEGRDQTAYNEDGLRKVYEVFTFFDVEGEGIAPYIITIDDTSRTVLSIYRNWAEDDEAQEELEWFVEFPFVPWRGAYPIGIPHMIGGIAAATTGALRALLDSAHIQNVPTMLKLKSSIGGQSISVQPTEVAELEGGMNVDDIRKLAMPMPFNPPSPTLYQLLGFLVDAGKGVVRTTMEEVGDNNPNAPVGTTLARLEQGMVVFSAIHARLHDSMARVLRILHRLNALYLDDDMTVEELGEELAKRKDFMGPLDVVPVSDPNIFSESQRYGQVQAIAQRAAALPQLYDLRKVEERVLETLKVPNAKELLVPPLQPREQNAVQENTIAAMGKPVIAFPEQDHIAHLKTHMEFIKSPVFGGNPVISPQLIPVMVNHLKEHMVLWYAQKSGDIADDAAGTDVGKALGALKDHSEKREIDQMLAEASGAVIDAADEVFAELLPLLARMQEYVQQMQPPGDPMQAELQRQAQMDSQKLALEGQKLQAKAQSDQTDALIEKEKIIAADKREMMRQEREDGRTKAELDARMVMNEADNKTALTLAQMEALSGERFAVSTGTGINP
ncbi:hypothetical protein [Caulobacter phage KcrB]|nr:hypothetical protein RW_GP094c [Caulobacter phage RW]WCA46398.1 hypothetical protein [Caulobacter phage KcrB]WCD56333.1 hypothetical protein [Caulobacter phage RLK]WNV48125.1 hypothetical protein GB2A_gp093c [Caulobacter phage GB2A]